MATAKTIGNLNELTGSQLIPNSIFFEIELSGVSSNKVTLSELTNKIINGDTGILGISSGITFSSGGTRTIKVLDANIIGEQGGSLLLNAGTAASNAAPNGDGFGGFGGSIKISGGTVGIVDNGGIGGLIDISGGIGGLGSFNANFGGNGGDLILHSGNGGEAGDGASGGNGGNIFIYGGDGGLGDPTNGIGGNIYFGTESGIGKLSVSGASDTTLVYYNPTSGQLSYGSIPSGSGGGFAPINNPTFTGVVTTPNLETTGSGIPVKVINNIYNEWVIQKRRTDDSQYLGIREFGNNGGLALVTNDANRLNITLGGNVGIGTTLPYEKLSVYGNITSTYVYGVSLLCNDYNNYDIDPTITLPVLSLQRAGKGGYSYDSTFQIGIGRYENSGVAARTQADFKLSNLCKFDPSFSAEPKLRLTQSVCCRSGWTWNALM